MYMPAGVSEIHCDLAGIAAAHVWIQVDQATAATLNADLKRVNEQNAPLRALFDKLIRNCFWRARAYSALRG